MLQLKPQCHPQSPLWSSSHTIKFIISMPPTLTVVSTGPELTLNGRASPPWFQPGSHDTLFPSPGAPLPRARWHALTYQPPRLEHHISVPCTPCTRLTGRCYSPGSGMIFTHCHTHRTAHGVWHTAGTSATTTVAQAVTADCSRHMFSPGAPYLVSLHHQQF